MKNTLRATALIAMMGVAQAASANLIVNGSFENPNVGVGGSFYNNILGWTGGQGGIELRENFDGVASHGHNYIELDTNFDTLGSLSNSSVSQAVTTTAGDWYKLVFDYSPRQNTSGTTANASVSFNGVTHTLTGTSLSSGNNWVTYDYTFQALSNNVDIKFAALGAADGFGANIDNVLLHTAVSPVPEASTSAMMFAGLGLMGFVARRRKSA